ncbi:hypothetical protein Csa_009733, partial [Cucumis sativus]
NASRHRLALPLFDPGPSKRIRKVARNFTLHLSLRSVPSQPRVANLHPAIATTTIRRIPRSPAVVH